MHCVVLLLSSLRLAATTYLTHRRTALCSSPACLKSTPCWGLLTVYCLLHLPACSQQSAAHALLEPTLIILCEMIIIIELNNHNSEHNIIIIIFYYHNNIIYNINIINYGSPATSHQTTGSQTGVLHNIRTTRTDDFRKMKYPVLVVKVSNNSNNNIIIIILLKKLLSKDNSNNKHYNKIKNNNNILIFIY